MNIEPNSSYTRRAPLSGHEHDSFPQPVTAKLQRRFAGQVADTAQLEEAIAEERVALAALSSSGAITGMGAEKQVSAGMNEYERVQAAFDGLFGFYESEAARAVPQLSWIREVFQVATGVDAGAAAGPDRPLREAIASGLRARMSRGHLTESEAPLREADVPPLAFPIY